MGNASASAFASSAPLRLARSKTALNALTNFCSRSCDQPCMALLRANVSDFRKSATVAHGIRGPHSAQLLHQRLGCTISTAMSGALDVRGEVAWHGRHDSG